MTPQDSSELREQDGPSPVPLLAIVTVLLLAILLATGTYSPAANASSKSSSSVCQRPRSRVKATSQDILVYAQAHLGVDSYYACRWGSKKRVKIGPAPDMDSTARVVIQGNVVALATSTCPRNGEAACGGFVRTTNVATRKVGGTWSLPRLSRSVGSLVVGANGFTAWMNTIFPSGDATVTAPAPITTIYRMSKHGTVTTVASGSDISQGSLALANSAANQNLTVFTPTLYWIQGGTSHSATLR